MNPLNELHFGFGKRLPALLQSEAAECGLVCLAMVAGYHGMSIDLLSLRKRFSISLKGANLNRLIDIAAQLGMSARPLRLELEELSQLKTPCILHWNMNHFVVLKSVGRKGIVIHDPGFGIKSLSFTEVSKHFTGVALELSPTPGFSQQAPGPRMKIRDLVGPVSGLWRSLGQILLFSAALQLFLLLTPFYMQWTVDQALVAGDRDLLAVLGLGFLLLVMFQVVVSAVRSWAVTYLGASLGVQWNARVFTHLFRLPMDWFEKRHLGDVVSRMSATSAIQKTLSTSFIEAIVDGLMAIATVAMMCLYSVQLALMSFAAVALYLGLRALAYGPVRAANEQQLACAAKQQSHLLESIRGVQTVKLTGSETQRRLAWQNLMVETVNQELRLGRLGIGFNSASSLVFGIERIAVIWLGATLVLDGLLSVGMLIAYVAYKDQFTGRMNGLVDKWIEFRMLRMHGERLADIVMTPEDRLLEHRAEGLEPIHSGLEVAELGYRYSEGEPWVLKDCSFTVHPGESVAIIGPSGCGKTTLAKVLLGLLPASEGSLSVGGRSIASLSAGGLRQFAAAVMQDDHLFAGSVADNICFFESGADPRRIEEAAQLAGVHADIQAMTMGYNTLIGDMGAALSGGQKQRLLLARALYRRPSLLVLDEATSHLDVARERLVNESVRALDITRIIIAHRPETIASADRVLVMSGGRIVDQIDQRAERSRLLAA